MKKFTTNNNTTTIVKINEDAMDDRLKAKVYTLGIDMFGGYFLTHTKDNFVLPKLYGNIHSRTERIMHTYNDRVKSTGVMLTGDKGSGKSLLAMNLGNTAIEAGIPVILINQAFQGDGFNTFMNDVGECVVMFDEFGKTYYDNDTESNVQDSLLTFLDGTMSTKRLTIITENKMHRIDEFIKDRPGRMFYHFAYAKLDEDTIREVCADVLTTDKVEGIVDLSRRVTTFSFDILMAIIHESNRYPEDSVINIADILNVPTIDDFMFEFHVVKAEKMDTNEALTPTTPILKSLHTSLTFNEKNEHDDAFSTYIANEAIVYEADNQIIFEYHNIRTFVNVVEKPAMTYTAYNPDAV